jgi:UDP-N-acetylglucosamine 2-epimerase (non-hydrolysing)
MLDILHVVGARPNFMKAAPVIAALRAHDGTAQTLVHTGQHYDANMSDIFFQQLGLPAPDINLGIGSGSHAEQTAKVMLAFERVVLDRQPDLVMVYGDINSTVAATLVSSKLGIQVAHVEAGLRSYDRTMPEELNRLVTDQLADLLLTPSEDGDANLLREGIPTERIHCVGNVMIDTLVRLLPLAAPPAGVPLDERYVLVTLHRPSNVDDPDALRRLIEALADLSRQVQIIFPIHPRTRQRLATWGIDLLSSERFLILDPLGYLQFLALQRDATAVITDSGGIQEETTYLGVPCLTMRENTERPITVTVGTNLMIGRDTARLCTEVRRILDGEAKRGHIPPLWDGNAAQRIADIVTQACR